MKKLAILLGVALALNILPANAEDKAEQRVDNNQSYLTANIQSQEKPEKQKIGNHFTFFTINIQVVRPLSTTDSTSR